MDLPAVEYFSCNASLFQADVRVSVCPGFWPIFQFLQAAGSNFSGSSERTSHLLRSRCEGSEMCDLLEQELVCRRLSNHVPHHFHVHLCGAMQGRLVKGVGSRSHRLECWL